MTSISAPESHLIPKTPQQTRWPNVCSMLDQRRRRWANIEPTLGQSLVFSGSESTSKSWANVELMLVQRDRRCPNVSPNNYIWLLNVSSVIMVITYHLRQNKQNNRMRLTWLIMYATQIFCFIILLNVQPQNIMIMSLKIGSHAHISEFFTISYNNTKPRVGDCQPLSTIFIFLSDEG